MVGGTRSAGHRLDRGRRHPSGRGTERLDGARAGANAVVIKKFAFHPKKLTVTKGVTLKVTNADGTVHTFSAKNGSFDTGELDGGTTATVALTSRERSASSARSTTS